MLKISLYIALFSAAAVIGYAMPSIIPQPYASIVGIPLCFAWGFYGSLYISKLTNTADQLH